MLIKLSGGKVYDPINSVNGQIKDIFIRDGRIVGKPSSDETIDETYDVRGRVVMAGGIDPHTHIGGGKVNIARMMLPEDHEQDLVKHTPLTRAGCGHAAPSTLTAGYRYVEMGYTAGFEPAMLQANARQAHMEMADTPIIDKGAYVMLGNDDMFMRMMAEGVEQEVMNNYVGWTISNFQAMAVKVVNPGGISAFKFNQRQLDLDEQHTHYQITPREVLKTLSRSLVDLKVPHPLHVHGCNLGVPGNVETTLETIRGMDGLPMHMTHIQFHSFATEGDKNFSSGAARIAEMVNQHKNISIDVGQIMFNQTVTASGDSMRQYAGHSHGSPKKFVVMDIECDNGCGVVPFKYSDKSFVNALQWAIGLETFLMVDDPWRVFLTTDHPNGAPFTSYPHLIRLLMDRSFRNDMLHTINKEAADMTVLGSIDREYSLYEIAIMTRAAPAKSLGLTDRGQLGAGAAADITVYKEMDNKEKMFEKPEYVFKDGELVAQNGKIVKVTNGTTHTIKPDYDKSIEKSLDEFFRKYHTVALENIVVSEDEIIDEGRGSVSTHICNREGTAA